jgi:hypothetical protein
MRIPWLKAFPILEHWRDSKRALNVFSTLPKPHGRLAAIVSVVSVEPPLIGLTIWRSSEVGELGSGDLIEISLPPDPFFVLDKGGRLTGCAGSLITYPHGCSLTLKPT